MEDIPAAGAPESPQLHWLNLNVIPPPAPFTRDVALRWLQEECAVRLATSPLDWSSWTLTVVRAVRAGLYERPNDTYPEPPFGFNALAEILEARIAVERLKEPERTKAAEALSYPMAEPEEAGAGEAE